MTAIPDHLVTHVCVRHRCECICVCVNLQSVRSKTEKSADGGFVISYVSHVGFSWYKKKEGTEYLCTTDFLDKLAMKSECCAGCQLTPSTSTLEHSTMDLSSMSKPRGKTKMVTAERTATLLTK